jgi:hypothetical protein
MASSHTDETEAKGVGRGRPPEHSRFKKGQSGNPAGRPPRNRDLKKLVEAELDQVVSLTEGGKQIRLTKREVIVKKMVNAAAGGDAKSLQALLKVIGGTSEPENPMIGIDPADLARFTRRYLGRNASQSAKGEEDEEIGPGGAEGQN